MRKEEESGEEEKETGRKTGVETDSTKDEIS